MNLLSTSNRSVGVKDIYRTIYMIMKQFNNFNCNISTVKPINMYMAAQNISEEIFAQRTQVQKIQSNKHIKICSY